MKKILLTLTAVTFLFDFASAQTFAPIQNIDPDTGDEPYEIASGDLDGDGDIDLVMATYNYADTGPTQDFVKWYMNDGIGNFAIQPVLSSTLTYIDGLEIMDIDGLYGNDIVATSVNQDKLVYFLSNDTAGFSAEVVIDNTIDAPGEIASGDINADGFMDIITMSFHDGVVWYANDGTGNFTLQPYIESDATDGPYYVDVGDFDGDTDLDVVVGFVTSQSIEIYYNQYIESGTMTVSWIKDTVPVDTGNSFLFEVDFADVNNDGNLDVVKVDNVSGDVAWYDKTINGPSVENIISEQSIIARPGTVFVADLNNDTYNDVIVTDGSSNDDALIWFQGALNASPSTTPTTIANNNYQMFDVTVADFDDDTDNDIATIGNFSDTVDWFENELFNLGLNVSNTLEISIYPNPTKEKLYVNGLTQDSQIRIFNVVGQEIHNEILGMGETLDVSQLQSGMYYLKFENSNVTHKFIKQ